jgi:DUF971 family protein
MTKILPTDITLHKSEGYLEVTWFDGEVSRYPLSHLREACPCADCRGGHQNMGLEHAPTNLLTLTPARSYKMENLVPVGNYAVQPIWDDGHNSGIYSWEYLHYIRPKKDAD